MFKSLIQMDQQIIIKCKLKIYNMLYIYSLFFYTQRIKHFEINWIISLFKKKTHLVIICEKDQLQSVNILA